MCDLCCFTLLVYRLKKLVVSRGVSIDSDQSENSFRIRLRYLSVSEQLSIGQNEVYGIYRDIDQQS